ncbi:unnamed protein product [Paramecium sonneborni]|uniref:Uncharacterized protein n=1 Tax=Paramecium sonneborni TaxID=65129 RepID=A0A8S1R3D0_9CILI|nr:unnamed protein product [Paramecium sonneborni]
MIHNFQKKLKLIINPISMTNQQQEYINYLYFWASQIKSSSKSHFSNINDPKNPVLLIIIQNLLVNINVNNQEMNKSFIIVQLNLFLMG